MRLDEKYQGTMVEGIFVTEDEISESYENIGIIQVKSLRMNSNLSELKKKLVRIAKLKKADAIICYKYGQKRTILSLWDDTKWYAEGRAIRIKNK